MFNNHCTPGIWITVCSTKNDILSHLHVVKWHTHSQVYIYITVLYGLRKQTFTLTVSKDYISGVVIVQI